MTARGERIIRAGRYAAALVAVLGASLWGRSIDRAIAIEPAIRQNNEQVIARQYVRVERYTADQAAARERDTEIIRRLEEIVADGKHNREILETLMLGRAPAPGWRRK